MGIVAFKRIVLSSSTDISRHWAYNVRFGLRLTFPEIAECEIAHLLYNLRILYFQSRNGLCCFELTFPDTIVNITEHYWV